MFPDRELSEQGPQPVVDHEDAPLAPPLAAHMETAPLAVEVRRPQLDEFRYAQTGRDQQEHGGSEGFLR